MNRYFLGTQERRQFFSANTFDVQVIQAYSSTGWCWYGTKIFTNCQGVRPQVIRPPATEKEGACERPRN